jgi:hypothetical protein
MAERLDEANETLEQLELLIGKDNARKVFEFFEGENIYFPKSIGLVELHNQIFADLQNGGGYGDVARKYHYSKSYIRKIEHKKTEERRRERKAGITTHGTPTAAGIPTAAGTAEPVRLTPHEKPFQQGDLFYEG